MKVYNNFDLTYYNSYRIKARCRKAFFLENENDLINYFKNNRDFILIGSGHNIILSKEFYDSDFIFFDDRYSKFFVEISSGIIEADAGITMLKLSEVALENSLSGVEIFFDIPSSLGGAIVMNAGASGEEIKDTLLKVRYFDLEDFQIKEILKEDISFEYRNSFFQKNKDKIVLKAWLQLHPHDKKHIWKKMKTMKTLRWEKQPRNFPNAGSVFKRPPGYFVGEIIDNLGLKGFAIGGAKISEKHRGFIINFNNASGKDILNLIQEIKYQVRNKYNIDLEIEQRII